MLKPVELLRWNYSPTSRVFTVGIVDCENCRHNRGGVLPGRTMLYAWKTCDPCEGKGFRARGQCRKCAYWRDDYTRTRMVAGYAPGMVPDYEAPRDGGICESCNGILVCDPVHMAYGNARVPQQMRDRMFDDIPVRINIVDVALSDAQMLCGVFDISTDTHLIEVSMTSSDGGAANRRIVQAALDGNFAAELEAFRAEIQDKMRGHLRSATSMGHALARGVRHEDPRFLLADNITVLVTNNGYVVSLVWDRERIAAVIGE